MTPVSGCVHAWCGAGDAPSTPRGLLQLANMLRARSRPQRLLPAPAAAFSPAYYAAARDASRTVAIRRRAFAGHFRLRHLRCRLFVWAGRTAMPSCGAGRWAGIIMKNVVLFSPFTTRYVDSAL